MTLGQERVRVNFNPSKGDHVKVIINADCSVETEEYEHD